MVLVVEEGSEENGLNSSRQPWQETSLCLAPSMNGAGWGVFAARPFRQGDIVEIAPLFVRFNEEERPKVLKETILNNYHYEHWTWTGCTHVLHSMVAFGYTMYYNHGPKPNIEHRKWGIEPDMTNMDDVVASGFYALRDIQVGEELINDYGGEEWFKTRGFKSFEVQPDKPPRRDMREYIKRYQSKLFAGYGQAKFQKLVKWHSEDRSFSPYDLHSMLRFLPRQDFGFGNVVAKSRTNPGDILEFAPALLLAKSYVSGTLLESVVVDWSDLCEPIEAEAVQIQYQPDAATVDPPTMLTVPVNETVLLPLAGNVGLLRRSKGNSNAKLRVTQDECNESGFCFHVVATKKVEVGEVIVVDLPCRDAEPLLEELACTGQPTS